MAEAGEGRVAGVGAAVASLVAGLAGGAFGPLATACAMSIVPGGWSDAAQLAAFSTPSLVAAVLGAAAVLLGGIAAWRSGFRWPGLVGLLGVVVGALDLAGAVAWWLFLGGLSVLAAFAWH